MKVQEGNRLVQLNGQSYTVTAVTPIYSGSGKKRYISDYLVKAKPDQPTYQWKNAAGEVKTSQRTPITLKQSLISKTFNHVE